MTPVEKLDSIIDEFESYDDHQADPFGILGKNYNRLKELRAMLSQLIFSQL